MQLGSINVFNADGQKIAKKLAVQIAREMKAMKALLPVYNACQVAIGGETLSVEEVLDPSQLSMMLRPLSSISSKSKHELIESFVHAKRAEEEIAMLEAEMVNVVKYYEHRRKVIQDSINLATPREDAFSRGALSLLQTMHLRMENKLEECKGLFKVTKESNGSEHDLDSDSELDFSSDEEDS